MHGVDCPEILWESPRGRFVFIVDCQPLAQILNGEAPLQQSALQPVFERMTRNLFQMISAGWSPYCLSASPVAWHRREYNKVADYIVNHTMEKREDWMHSRHHDTNLGIGNFICHSDGGTRQGTCSAAGWIIEAVVQESGQSLQLPIAMSGKYLPGHVSPFTAELIALDEAISYMYQIVSNIPAC